MQKDPLPGTQLDDVNNVNNTQHALGRAGLQSLGKGQELRGAISNRDSMLVLG